MVAQVAGDNDPGYGETAKMLGEAATAPGYTPDALRNVIRNIAGEIGESDAWVAGQMRVFSSRWMRQFLAFDPAPVYASLRLPVLALFGMLDNWLAFRSPPDSS